MIHRSVSSLSPVKPLGSGIGALNCRSPWGQTGAALWLQRGPHTHTNLHHYLSLYLRSLLSSCLVKPPPPPLFPSLHFPEGMIDSHTLSTDTLTATAQPLWYVGWGVCVCVCVWGVAGGVMVKEGHAVLWLTFLKDAWYILAVAACGGAFVGVWVSVRFCEAKRKGGRGGK